MIRSHPRFLPILAAAVFIQPSCDSDPGSGLDSLDAAVPATDAASVIDAADLPAADACAEATWYVDCDGDGLAASDEGATSSCSTPAAAPASCSNLVIAGWTTTAPADLLSQDCDDGDDTVGEAPTWYVDCDGDGYAASIAGSKTACAIPTPACSGSAATWTELRPIGAPDAADNTTVDCVDSSAAAHSGQAAWQLESIPGVGGSGAFDYDCDGQSERRFTAGYTCSVTPFGEGFACIHSPGYSGAPAACGQSGNFLSGCTLNGPSLTCSAASSAPRDQECR
jgi:hypothetical protein